MKQINRLSDIVLPGNKRGASKLEKFISELAKDEAGKSQAKIGDIRQILKLANEKLGGIIYAAVNLRK